MQGIGEGLAALAFWGFIAAVVVALGMLAFLLISITVQGYSAFVQSEAALEITFDADTIDPQGTRDPAVLSGANYQRLISRSLYDLFPEVTDRRGRSALRKMVSAGAQYELRDMVVENPGLIGTTGTVQILLHSDIDQLNKGFVDRTVPEGRRNEAIASFTGHLLWHGIDPDVARELLLCWNRAHCQPPLSDDEVARTVESITRTHLRHHGEPDAEG